MRDAILKCLGDKVVVCMCLFIIYGMHSALLQGQPQHRGINQNNYTHAHTSAPTVTADVEGRLHEAEF